MLRQDERSLHKISATVLISPAICLRYRPYNTRLSPPRGLPALDYDIPHLTRSKRWTDRETLQEDQSEILKQSRAAVRLGCPLSTPVSKVVSSEVCCYRAAPSSQRHDDDIVEAILSQTLRSIVFYICHHVPHWSVKPPISNKRERLAQSTMQRAGRQGHSMMHGRLTWNALNRICAQCQQSSVPARGFNYRISAQRTSQGRAASQRIWNDVEYTSLSGWIRHQ